MQKMNWLRVGISAIVLWLAASRVALTHQLVEQFSLMPENEILIDTQTFQRQYNETVGRLGMASEYILPEIQMEPENQWYHQFSCGVTLTIQCKDNPHQISEIVFQFGDTSVSGQLSLSLISLVIISTLSDQLEPIQIFDFIVQLTQDAYDQGEIEIAIYGISYTMKFNISHGFRLFVNPTSAAMA